MLGLVGEYGGRKVQIFNWNGGQPTERFLLDSTGSVTAVALAPDNATCVVAHLDGPVPLSFWDTSTGKKTREIRELGPSPGRASALAYAADGRHLFVGNNNGTIYVLRLAPTPIGREGKK
jgi:WD40 repeat protein